VDEAYAEGHQWRGRDYITYFTVAECCMLSRLSRATVYRAMAAGHLDYVQHEGRGRRIDEADFVSWMDSGFPCRRPGRP
jgi:excisionase family DNA binding protein